MKKTLKAIAHPDALTSGDLVEIANLIVAVDEYRTVEDCARDIVRAVQRLQESEPNG